MTRMPLVVAVVLALAAPAAASPITFTNGTLDDFIVLPGEVDNSRIEGTTFESFLFQDVDAPASEAFSVGTTSAIGDSPTNALAVVPEPASIILVASGLAFAAAARRRLRTRATR